MSITSRGYTPADLLAIVDLARHELAQRHLRPYYYHPGDECWNLAGYGPTEGIRLWFEDDLLVGWAALEPPVRLAFNVRGGVETRPDVAREMVAWAEPLSRQAWDRTPGGSLPRAYAMLPWGSLSIEARDTDSARIALFESLGYARGDRGNFRFAQPLDAIPGPELPSGFTLRYPNEDDLDERVDLHRDAWSVWGPSQFSLERYRKVRATPSYREDLDVVLEAPDGHFVSYCICWADDATGVGLFEPVGTRPAYAGQGLGRQTILDGLRRLKAAGMLTATVATASVNDGAAALYKSCGFELVDMEHMYTKVL